eukprot:531057-Alexandrium_andersonii.AAC.2
MGTSTSCGFLCPPDRPPEPQKNHLWRAAEALLGVPLWGGPGDGCFFWRAAGGSGGRQSPGQAQETRRKRYYPFVPRLSFTVCGCAGVGR